MHAIRIEKTGGPEVIEYADIAQPSPNAGELLVRVGAAGVNFIDCYYRSGLYKADLPYTLGLEGAGAIVATGDGVSEFKTGERVAWASAPGSYAEFAIVPAAKAVAIPASIDDRIGAAIMLQGMTAAYLSLSTYPIKKGDTVLVHAGAGGVGLLLTQFAKHLGARVISTVSTDEKATLAKGAGADDVILYTKADFEAETKRVTEGKGVAAVYDSVGVTTFEKSLNVLRPLGTMVLYGASSGPVPPFDLSQLAAKGSLFITRPTLFTYTAQRADLLRYANAVFDGIKAGWLKIRTEHDYPLREAARAHRDLEGRKTTGKLILLPSGT